jgi:hypothetical protein
MTDQCANHPARDAITSCASCGRGLCDECWLRTVDRQPWCELCIHHLKSAGRSLAVAVLFILLSVSTGTVLWRRDSFRHQEHSPYFWGSYFVLTVVGAIYFGTRKPRPHHYSVKKREVQSSPIDGHGPRIRKPLRTTLARSLALVASPLSGLWTSTLLIACMIIEALAVPRLLQLPRWIEAEWVVLTWWAIWATLLTLLLYRGWHISDDHVLALPRTIWTDNATNSDGSKRDWCNPGCDPTIGCSDGIGCGEALFAALVVAALLAVSWFVVEFLVPGLFFLVYFLVRSSLARVANDRHDCQARFGKSLFWGIVWASLYALPMAAMIFVVHHFVRYN